MLHAGTDLNVCDYDSRTAMHLAACEGHSNVVRFLLRNVAPQDRQKLCRVTDRWGGTPLGEALHKDHGDVATLIRRAGGNVGETAHLKNVNDEQYENIVSADAPGAIFSAAAGELDDLINLYACGIDFGG